jgi:hypothetical protein
MSGDDLQGMSEKAKATIAAADELRANMNDPKVFAKFVGLIFKAGYEQCEADTLALLEGEGVL